MTYGNGSTHLIIILEYTQSNTHTNTASKAEIPSTPYRNLPSRAKAMAGVLSGWLQDVCIGWSALDHGCCPRRHGMASNANELTSGRATNAYPSLMRPSRDLAIGIGYHPCPRSTTLKTPQDMGINRTLQKVHARRSADDGHRTTGSQDSLDSKLEHGLSKCWYRLGACGRERQAEK